MSYLIMRRGPDPGTIFRLDLDEVTIGRGSKNTIIIHDNDVSREHVLLTKNERGYDLEDLGSANGTYINGQKVNEVWSLTSQCIIEFGHAITLEYRPGEPEQYKHVPSGKRRAAGVGQAYLIVTKTVGRDAPVVYALEEEVVSVGRATNCDIVVVEPELSRTHFQLFISGPGYYIQDLNSTNGTRVNGVKLEEDDAQLLHTGDVIQIGEMIQFQFTDSPEMYVSGMQTDVLGDTEKPATQGRRTTAMVSVPDVMKNIEGPTNIGTGVDQTTLHDEVLIAYDRTSWADIVGPMIVKFEEEEVPYWVDQYLVADSKDWQLAVEQARLECWCLVVVVTKSALESDVVRRYWRHFKNREKPIFMLMVEDVARLPIGAKSLPRIQYNPEKPDVAFERLINSIKRTIR